MLFRMKICVRRFVSLAGLQEKTGKEFVLSSVPIIQSVCWPLDLLHCWVTKSMAGRSPDHLTTSRCGLNWISLDHQWSQTAVLDRRHLFHIIPIHCILFVLPHLVWYQPPPNLPAVSQWTSGCGPQLTFSRQSFRFHPRLHCGCEDKDWMCFGDMSPCRDESDLLAEWSVN